MQEVQALAFQFRVEEDDTCDVAARTGVTLRPSCCDRVLTCIRHDDGNGAGRRPSRSDRSRSNGNDNIRFRRDEFDSQSRKALVGIIRGEDLNAEVTSFHEPELRQFREVQLTEHACAELVRGQQADPPDLLRRLRKEWSREQRGSKRTEQEVSSPHGIPLTADYPEPILLAATECDEADSINVYRNFARRSVRTRISS